MRWDFLYLLNDTQVSFSDNTPDYRSCLLSNRICWSHQPHQHSGTGWHDGPYREIKRNVLLLSKSAAGFIYLNSIQHIDIELFLGTASFNCVDSLINIYLKRLGKRLHFSISSPNKFSSILFLSRWDILRHRGNWFKPMSMWNVWCMLCVRRKCCTLKGGSGAKNILCVLMRANIFLGCGWDTIT